MGKQHHVRTYYNAYSKNYDSFYKSIQASKFNQLSKNLVIREWVCDLGGGTGLFSDWMQYPFLTIDVSFDMLANGISKNRPFCPVAGDLQKLPIRSNSITTAYSFTVLQNVPDEHQAWNELQRVLRCPFCGIVTLLKKASNASKWSDLLKTSQLFFREIQLSGEDDCYILSNSDTSSSGS